jgi:hypothetical protein
MLVPYPVRVGLWLAILAIVALILWRLDSALEEHYVGEQNRLVLEDANRTNAAAVKRLQAQKDALTRVLADREKRLKAAGAKTKEQDDEMARLKAERPDVDAWAKGAVPDPVRARHGVR